MKVLFAVTHLQGVGHLSRTIAIAQAFLRAGWNATVISGGMPAPHIDKMGVTVIQLPPVRVHETQFGALRDEMGQLADARYLAARRRKLLECFVAIDPDVLITELYPFGRRALADEFDELLACAVARVRKPVVLSSVRDILVPPSKHEQVAAAEQRLVSWYDGVLVHSDPGTIALAASWPTTAAIESLLHYTGFVAHPPSSTSPVGPGMGDILVFASRRPGGARLFEAALDAASSHQDRTWRLLVGGSDAEYWLPRWRARKSATRVTVELVRPDFRDLLARAAAYVGQCGYNTSLDLLLSGTPAVLVPFEAGEDTEQVIRAHVLADRGSFIVLRQADLSAEKLNRSLDAICNAPRRIIGTCFDGATRSVEIVTQYVGKHKSLAM